MTPHLQVKYDSTISLVIHPISNSCASSRIPFLQCSSALFLSSSIELLLYSCCAFPFIGCAAFSSSILLSLFSPSCTGLLSFWCAFPLSGCATLFAFFSYRGHSLHLCPSFPHLKHLIATVLILLTTLSSTPHCITLLLKILNLFWGVTTSFSSFFSFLQFQARCLNPLQLLQSFPFLSSNFTLSLARACFSLSRLLNKVLYCS